MLTLLRTTLLFLIMMLLPVKDTLATMQRPTCQLAANSLGHLTFTLDNQTEQIWSLLTWQTPFDAWFSEFITIRHQQTDQKIIYQGALAKRAAINADDYLTLPAHSHHVIQLDLSQVYNLSEGHYDVSLISLRLLPHNTDLSQPSQEDNFIFVDCPSTQMNIVK